MQRPLIVGLLLIAIGMSITTSCKKGENDPFFTFLSRKARITGVWRPVVVEINETWNDSTLRFSLTGGYMNIKINAIELGGYTYDEKLTIDKDSKFEWYLSGGGVTQNFSGSWFFAGKNEQEDTKNKEVVIFAINSQSETPGMTYTFAGIQTNIAYQIDGLRKKEMTLMIEYDYYNLSGDKVHRSETRRYSKEE